MAHEGIYATSAECIAKLGSGYNSTAVNEAMINGFCLQAEGLINGVCRNVFATTSGAFAVLPAGGKYLLTEVASSLVGIYGLTYKPKGETGTENRIEFEDKINVLRDAALRGLAILRDKKVVTFLTSGS